MIEFKKFNKTEYHFDTIVTDQNLSQLFDLTGQNVVTIPAGEQAKTFSTVEHLCDEFLKRGLEKSSKIVAVGGGSVGDVVGFSASIFKRGLKLLHVPTTLLAMIDSSIGGKTGINFHQIKNAVGTIYPADTLIDTDFLKTLPKNLFDDAKGEVEKYRLLSKSISEISPTDTSNLVRQCALFKQEVASHDMLDNDSRRQLNMGHTIGHALELQLNLSHGQAVLFGLSKEMQLANHLGILSSDFVENWHKKTGVNSSAVKISEKTISTMCTDKKNSDGKICFVFADGNFGYVVKNLDKKVLEEFFLC